MDRITPSDTNYRELWLRKTSRWSRRMAKVRRAKHSLHVGTEPALRV